jgi:hypothetical protein
MNYNLTWDDVKGQTHISENLSAPERSHLISRINGVKNIYGQFRTQPLLKKGVDFIISHGEKLFTKDSVEKIKKFKKEYLKSKKGATSQGQLERNFKAYIHGNRAKEIENALNNVKSLGTLLTYASMLHKKNLMDQFYPVVRTRRLTLVQSYKGR